MQVSVENIGTLERKLTVRFPAERYEAQVNTRIAEMGRTVRLKGFRPGKVPTTVIKQRFGAQVRGEVLTDLINTTLREAVTQEKLNPIANPAIDTTGEPQDGEIAYTATFEIMPEFPSVDVAALQIQRAVAAVSDADSLVSDVLQHLSNGFDEQHRQLEAQWNDGEPDTEGLRSARQRSPAMGSGRSLPRWSSSTSAWWCARSAPSGSRSIRGARRLLLRSVRLRRRCSAR